MPFSLFRYPGGKYYALKSLLLIIEKFDHDEFREPFFGGGTVFFNKKKCEVNIINDKYSDLVEFLKFIQNEDNSKKLIKIFETTEIPTKENHQSIKKMLPMNQLEKAFKFYYLNRTSFSGKMKNPHWGYRPIRSVPPKRWFEKIAFATKKLDKVKIENKDFEEIILRESSKKVLLYLDPPYYLANQKDHYVESFSQDDHLRLLKTLRQTNHSFILSYDDCPEIRDLYKDFFINEMDFFYRIENSNDNFSKRKKINELIISNKQINKV